MRHAGARDERGFTLVELMIVVAIIGVLAALGVVGVQRYLRHARTAEAKNAVGAITRTAALQYEHERNVAEIPTVGGVYTANTHLLCGSADPVPLTLNLVQGVKYQPSTAAGVDFMSGTSLAGWQCLGFAITEPIYYQYHYHVGGGYVSAGLPGAALPSVPEGFEAAAVGDTDADGEVSTFARTGEVRDGDVVLNTTVFVDNDGE
jgi:type IV pilus assembly protein PilA